MNKIRTIIGAEENLAQIAIAFCLAYDAVSTVIPGNVNIEQLTSNVQSADISIPQNLIEKLESLYQWSTNRRFNLCSSRSLDR